MGGGCSQVAAGELTPGITASEYADRRRALAAALPVGALAVLTAAPTVYMTGVIPYPYRQHADFLYLTGLTQPGAAMTLQRTGDGDQHVYRLFVPDRAPNADLWNGWRVNRASAQAVFGAHHSHFAAELAQHVSQSQSQSASQSQSSPPPFMSSAAASGVCRLPSRMRT